MMAHTDTNDNSEPAHTVSPTLKWGWLLLLMVIGISLRLWGIDYFRAYNGDEALHINIASGASLMQVLQFSRYEIHPPLLYIILHYWMMLSADPLFVRIIPITISVGLIPLYYLIGRKMNGEIAGLCCATLMTFSHGAILQSYMVRQYGLLLLFLSLQLLCYLYWHEEPKRKTLLGYVLLGWLAVLSHFTAIFGIFSIAVFEIFALLHGKKEKRVLAEWIVANLAIAALAVYLYLLWLPAIRAHADYFIRFYPLSPDFHAYLWDTIKAPFSAAAYIYPSFSIVLFMAAYLLMSIRHREGRNRLWSYIALAGVAFLVSELLYATGAYNSISTRHNLWILPLVIAPAGVAAAALLKMGTEFAKVSSRIFLGIIAFSCLYELGNRFDDTWEYSHWQHDEWAAVTQALSDFGPHDLINVGSGTGMMLTNIYPYLGKDAFIPHNMASIAPYHNTHLLFNPYYAIDYNTPIMLSTLQTAEQKHLLDGIDRVAFLRMPDSESPVTDLLLCTALQKQVIAFPPLPSDHPLVRGDFPSKSAILMVVSTQVLKQDILSPTGKAHNCLDGRHDMIPQTAEPAARP